ncbi:MAG: molybdenum cofactor guanylyltransferase [Armatimonadota bacterium]|nr:molybdenum cofactor guanylyltransferase [Armatimonadota bacterium]
MCPTRPAGIGAARGCAGGPLKDTHSLWNAGIVLAGGRSRRLGVDKAALRLGDETLLARAVRRLAAVCRPVIVVAASAPAARALLASVATPRESQVAVVADRWPEAGPLGGLATGLRFLEGAPGEPAGGEAALAAVVAVDMPFVAPAVLARLIAIARAGGQDAVVPVVGGRAQPLCAVYAARVASVAEDLLSGPRRAMHALLDALGSRVAYVSEEVLRADDPELHSFFNINTPDDLVRAREIAAE